MIFLSEKKEVIERIHKIERDCLPKRKKSMALTNEKKRVLKRNTYFYGSVIGSGMKKI